MFNGLLAVHVDICRCTLLAIHIECDKCQSCMVNNCIIIELFVSFMCTFFCLRKPVCSNIVCCNQFNIWQHYLVLATSRSPLPWPPNLALPRRCIQLGCCLQWRRWVALVTGSSDPAEVKMSLLWVVSFQHRTSGLCETLLTEKYKLKIRLLKTHTFIKYLTLLR